MYYIYSCIIFYISIVFQLIFFFFASLIVPSLINDNRFTSAPVSFWYYLFVSDNFLSAMNKMSQANLLTVDLDQ